ncbi:MAG: hypothetical protein GU356_00565 [Pyrobaculum sp.]|jgi:hypothetical protein|nr:hypothetical protein [Pyrobaculum sp.]
MTIDRFLLPQTIDVLKLEMTMSPIFGGQTMEWWSYQYNIYEVENFVLWLHVFFVGWGAVFVAIAAALAAVWVIAAWSVAVIVAKYGVTVKGLP